MRTRIAATSSCSATSAWTVKLLARHGSGMVLVTKWLQRGLGPPIRDGVVHLSAIKLAMLLDGLEWTRVSPKPVKQSSGGRWRFRWSM
jgi:transposase